MTIINRCNFNDHEMCRSIFEIRRKVFVEEQKVSREEEFDEYEKSSIHYLGIYDGIPAGTARWRITGEGIKLERFAVLPEFRLHGVAREILHSVLEDVKPTGVKIYLNSQESATGFYKKYGFQVEGDLFVEANINHFKMVYKGYISS